MQNQIIFHCERCGVEHDYTSSKDGLIQTIAHLIYEEYFGYDLLHMRTPERDLENAKEIFAWFTGAWPSEHYDYFNDLAESNNEKYAVYFKAWSEKNGAEPAQPNTRPDENKTA